MDPGELVTIKQVAATLNVSIRTVRRMCKEGKLSPPRRLTDGVSRWFSQDIAVYRYRLFRGDFEK
jgi:DNA-binding transcriptional MerR regulator